MNIMKIHKINRIGSKRLEYVYSIEGEWKRYFEESNPMWVEYSKSVEYVPDSIAIIPLIGNVIVLASLMNAEIYVDEIDRDFYECIEEFIQGFDDIMPEHVNFKKEGLVRAKNIVEKCLLTEEKETNLLFYSGGVDATSSLISHLDEKPTLVTIWGADIPYYDLERWKRAIEFNQKVADRYDLQLLTIQSNFRKSLQDDNVNVYSMELVKDWWWSAFHHSVAMMCLAAPIANSRCEKIYFGSSFSEKDKKEWGSYVIASVPQIDNHVRFCGCKVTHDGFEFSRYDKIKRICDFYKNQNEKPYLRVCYLSSEGTNCGTCEKCAIAIMGILLAGEKPEDYGFCYEKEEHPKYFSAGIQELARMEKYDFLSQCQDIQIAYKSKYKLGEIPPELRLFYVADLEMLADFLHVPNNECIAMDKAAKKHQAFLYDKIGQLQYMLETKENFTSDMKNGESRNSVLKKKIKDWKNWILRK